MSDHLPWRLLTTRLSVTQLGSPALLLPCTESQISFLDFFILKLNNTEVYASLGFQRIR